MKNIKKYIILGYNKEENKYYGYAEHSFSMKGSDNSIRVYTENFVSFFDPNASIINRKQKKRANIALNNKKYKGFHADHVVRSRTNPNSRNQYLWFWLRDNAQQLNKTHYKNCEWKIYRVNSKNCPVTVDLDEKVTDKFSRLNKHFHVI